MQFGNLKCLAKQEILWLRKYVWKYTTFLDISIALFWNKQIADHLLPKTPTIQFNRKFQVHAFISETKKYMKNMKMWINQTKKLYVRFEFVLKFTAKITKENVRKKTNESNFDFPIVKFTISKFS